MKELKTPKQEERTFLEETRDHTVECGEVFWDTLKPLVPLEILLCDVHLPQNNVYVVECYYSWHGEVLEYTNQVLYTGVIDEKRLNYFVKVAEVTAKHLNKWVSRNE